MENYVLVKDENGNDIKIEVILSFKVEEYNKQYVAYTLNDDGMTEKVSVIISEIDSQTNKLISIPSNQMKVVIDAYEEAKRLIIE